MAQARRIVFALVLSALPGLALAWNAQGHQEVGAVADRMKEFSASIVASTPEQLGDHVKAELAKWAPIVKSANVTMD